MSNDSSADLVAEDDGLLQAGVLLPEVAAFFFLSAGIYGMYHGIEIGHPGND
jgi:hypothetical protein